MYLCYIYNCNCYIHVYVLTVSSVKLVMVLHEIFAFHVQLFITM